VSKHVIRIPPLLAGRGVRWTITLSADVDGEDGVHRARALKKGKAPRLKRRKPPAARRLQGVPMSTPSSGTTTSNETAVKAPAATSEPHQRGAATSGATGPPAVGRTKSGYAIGLAVLGAVILAVAALPRFMPPVGRLADSGGKAEAQAHLLGGDSLGPPIAGPTAPAVTSSTAPITHGKAPHTVVQPPTRTSPTSAKSLAAAPSVPALPPATQPHDDSSAKLSDAGSATGTAPELASSGTETTALPPVTITGCLEISADQDRFRLTDTEGASAPKARSWRTAFFKKRSAAVDLVEPPDSGALQRQVGKRVAATGVLTSRELKVSSVRVVSASCN